MGKVENSISATLSSASRELSMSTSGNHHQIHAPPFTVVVPSKKKRNLPRMPDPDAEVVALSPTTLLATNRFVCEVCGKGFQRDQNLQLHRRGHNLPWKLKQRDGKEVRKRVYVCPELTCVHHSPSCALGDLTGIKKHFCRKHGEKKWNCERCSKKYAVLSDLKAHVKTCGTREYRCDCGTVFSRRDSFTTHRAFCEALAEESVKVPRTLVVTPAVTDGVKVPSPPPPPLTPSTTVLSPGLTMQSSELPENSMRLSPPPQTPTGLMAAPAATISSSSSSSSTSVLASIFTSSATLPPDSIEPTSLCLSPSLYLSTNSYLTDQYATGTAAPPPPAMSATALLQKAAQMGASTSNQSFLRGLGLSITSSPLSLSSQGHVKTEVTAGLELGLRAGGLTTLDLLGLGLNAGSGSTTRLSTLLTPFGGGFDMGAAAPGTIYGGGSSSGQGWDSGPDRK